MIKSHLLYQLSYRGQAGRDSSEFDFRCHFGEGLFSYGSGKRAGRGRLVKSATMLTMRGSLDKVHRTTSSLGSAVTGRYSGASFTIVQFEEAHS